MDIERYDADGIDLPLATDLAAVTVAALEDVPVARPTGESLLLDTRHSEEPIQSFWIARDAGAVVGWARLVETRREYLDTAFLGGAVAPAHQRRGIGRALLAEATSATTREILRVRAWRGTAGARSLPMLGFRKTMSHDVRRLSLAAPDPGWTELRAEALGAAGGYELTRYRGPTPPELLDERVGLLEAINDAPDAHEWEAYPVERITAYEQSLVARHQTQYAVVARHRSPGAPAGITIVCVPELAPGIAAQEDTSVLPAHRGHRLGLRLKLEMADWLRAERPDVRAVDTWNDVTNAPMIAVNDRLGARVVARTSVYRRPRR